MEILNYKTLRRKHIAKLKDLELGNDILDMTPKAQMTKEKVYFMNIKKYCSSKDTIRNFTGDPVVKNLSCNAEDMDSIPGR